MVITGSTMYRTISDAKYHKLRRRLAALRRSKVETLATLCATLCEGYVPAERDKDWYIHTIIAAEFGDNAFSAYLEKQVRTRKPRRKNNQFILC